MRGVSLAFGFLLFLAGGAAAQQQVPPGLVGGHNGGSAFADLCPTGSYLAGFQIGDGDLYVESIKPYCAGFDAAIQQVKGRYPSVNGPFGGEVGAVKEGFCPDGHILTGLYFGQGPKPDEYGDVIGGPLDFVELRCSPIGSGGVASVCLDAAKGCGPRIQRNNTYSGGTPMDTRIDHIADCPAGEAVAGIAGRSGTAVDGLGVICSSDDPVRTANEAVAALCNDYVAKAIIAITEASQLGCGFQGDAWTTNADAHLAWCMAPDNNRVAAINQQTAARTGKLDECRLGEEVIVGADPGTIGSAKAYPPGGPVDRPAGDVTTGGGAAAETGFEAAGAATKAPSDVFAGSGATSPAPAADPAGLIPAPSPSQGIDFSGVWRTATTGGGKYRMSLLQDGTGRVTGEYAVEGSSGRSQIAAGSVVGGRAIVKWVEGGRTGLAVFAMRADHNTFIGRWAEGARMPGEGDPSWNGNREGPAQQEADDEIAGRDDDEVAVAVVIQGVTIRAKADRKSKALGTLAAGSEIDVLGCDKNWCQFRYKKGAAFASRQYLDLDGSAPEIAAVEPAEEPAPKPQQKKKPKPEPEVEEAELEPSFAGSWSTVANGGTWRYDMQFSQDGRSVKGSYVAFETGIPGRITGKLKGNVLSFRWKDQAGGKYGGEGELTLSDDGTSFDGTYVVTDIPEGFSADRLEGTWHGERQ